MTLPWWLRPWKEVHSLRRRVVSQDCVIEDIKDLSSVLIAAARERDAEAARAEQLTESLRRQLAAAVTGARASGSALSTAMPEFVLVGTPRGPGLGKRLMASKDVTTTAFAMTEESEPPPRWKIGAIMERMLVIDKPSYGEALEHLATIWRNWDQDGKDSAAAAGRAVTGVRGTGLPLGLSMDSRGVISGVPRLPAVPGVGPARDAEQVHTEQGEPGRQDAQDGEDGDGGTGQQRQHSGDGKGDHREDAEHG